MITIASSLGIPVSTTRDVGSDHGRRQCHALECGVDRLLLRGMKLVGWL